ncbi:MAG: DUF853 family protein [Tissierellia bacterium]|nr:DUF853 family protein [Tissierellia bacterium]
MADKFLIGKGKDPIYINLSKLNRHGFITGATGSGKTITLKVMAENLSKEGIPVFLSDIKGDVSSICQKGEINEKIQERIQANGLEDFEPREFPVEFFDVFGQEGIALRATISEMGPILLSRLLGLNAIQEGILNICFRLADDKGWLLIDIKDLRSMLNYVGDNAKELSNFYGNISKASVSAILRSLLVLEDQGGDLFFGEPNFDINDFLRRDEKGLGMINILSSQKLFNHPMLYSTFLLWLLSELYESLPEVGDLDRPKIVFFFDEAHLLFDNQAKAVLDKIEMIVRLIRSKGVGIFFVTQKATDIPDDILAQCGNRIQHALRAYTPKEQKEIRAVADSFRQDEGEDLVEVISNLEVGQAVISILDQGGKPSFAQKALINPPESKIASVDPIKKMQIINNSQLYNKYSEEIDPESAYEILLSKREEEKDLAIKAQESLKRKKEEALIKKEEEKIKAQEEKELKRQSQLKDKRKTGYIDRLANNVIGAIGREIGRQITRGIFGTRRK